MSSVGGLGDAVTIPRRVISPCGVTDTQEAKDRGETLQLQGRNGLETEVVSTCALNKKQKLDHFIPD